ncbi:MAG: substrate-binding periplasmic protein [Thermotogota bacterium]
MKSFNLRAFFLMFILVVFCFLGFAENKEITMLFGGGYPPFYLEGPEDGKTPVEQGMFVDFLEKFEEEYGYTITKIRLPRKRMDLWMSSGQAQAFSLNNPMFVEDSDDYLFSDPIWHTKDVVISLKSNQVIYQKPQDLFDVTVAKIAGNGYGDLDAYFESGQIAAYDVKSTDQMIKMLLSGRVDCIIQNIHVFPYIAKNEGIDVSQFFFNDVALFEFELMTQINQEYTQFRDDLNAFIEAYKQNGFLEGIEKEYLGN